MKNYIISAAVIAFVLTACNSSEKKSTENTSVGKDTVTVSPPVTIAKDSNNTVSIEEIVKNYLQLKNDFTKDNTRGAALTATALKEIFQRFNKTTLTATQKNTFEDIADDAIEHAGHIAKNGGNIAHQREHFKMLSEDIYDLVKAFGPGQVLYKDFCPMYNDGKGGFWLSETKEIRNPFFGKAMSGCGEVKEEIK